MVTYEGIFTLIIMLTGVVALTVDIILRIIAFINKKK